MSLTSWAAGIGAKAIAGRYDTPEEARAAVDAWLAAPASPKLRKWSEALLWAGLGAAAAPITQAASEGHFAILWTLAAGILTGHASTLPPEADALMHASIVGAVVGFFAYLRKHPRPTTDLPDAATADDLVASVRDAAEKGLLTNLHARELERAARTVQIETGEPMARDGR